MKVSLLFPTWNRLEFSRLAIETLTENTSPNLVSDLILVDACSEDGTSKHLEASLERLEPFGAVLSKNPVRHIVSTMTKAARIARSDWIAKIDSDTMVPPGWLEACLETVRAHPELWALGVGPTHDLAGTPANGEKYAGANSVGGVGLFRKAAWEGIEQLDPPYSGWMEHQQKSSWVKGWAYPPVKAFQLNRLPFEPFIGLSTQYETKGWQRPWQRYFEWEEDLWSWKYPHWKGMI